MTSNDYLGSDYSILPAEATERNNTIPTLLTSKPTFEVWHLLDRSYEIPTVNIQLQLSTNLGLNDPIEQMLMLTFAKMFNMWGISGLYEEMVAGYAVAVGVSFNGLVVGLSGFEENMEKWAGYAVEMVRHFDLQGKEGMFKEAVDEIHEGLSNL